MQLTNLNNDLNAFRLGLLNVLDKQDINEVLRLQWVLNGATKMGKDPIALIKVYREHKRIDHVSEHYYY